MEFVEPIRDRKHIQRMKESFKSPRDRFLFVLGINTALRVSDLLELRVKHVRGKSHLIINEAKTGKGRKQIISQALKAEIDKYTQGMNDDDLLFTGRKKAGWKDTGRLSRTQAYRIIKEVAEDVGIPNIGTHTLRKTWAYHYYQQTYDVVTVQQLLNHSSPAETLRYIGVNQDVMDDKLRDFSL